MATYKTKDGIVLNNVPDDVPEEQVKARIAKIRAERDGRGGFSDATKESMRAADRELYKPDPSVFDFSPVNMVKNIPGSVAQLGKDAWAAITDPIGTSTAMAGLGLDVASEMEGEPNTHDLTKHVLGIKGRPASAMVSSLKDDYGSPAAFTNTLENDPAAVALDASGVGYGAGRLLKSTKLANTAQTIDPVNTIVNALRYGTGKAIPKRLPESMYEGAVKFGTTVDERRDLVQTALKEKIMPTQAGIDKLNAKVSKLSSEIDDIVMKAEKAGKTIPRGDVFRHIDDIRRELGDVTQVRGTKNVKVVDQIIDNYKAQLDAAGLENYSPSQVQNLKKNIYADLEKAWKKGNKLKPTEDTLKGLARGARESVEDIDPRIAGLNSEAGALLNLRDPLTRSANRIDNRDFVGIDPVAKAGLGGLLAGDAGVVAGTTAAVAGYPKIKAANAILLESLRNPNVSSLTKNRVAPMMLKQALLQSGEYMND